MNASETAEVIIIGGGIIGLSLARELKLRGAGRVVLLEKQELGAEASHAAGGMLAPQAEAEAADEFFALACASRDAYPEFAAQLLAETGMDVELDQTGTLYLAFSQADEREIRQRYDWQKATGWPVEMLTGAEARRREGRISPEICAALFFPRDWQVDNRLLCQALAESCRKLGVVLRPQTPAREILLEHDRAAGVATRNSTIAAPLVVLAAGAWAGGLWPRLKIAPVKGQMLCLQAEAGFMRHVVYSPRGYLVPRRDGRVLAGATTEDAGFDKTLTLGGVHAVATRALEIAPALSARPLAEMWAGLRPRALDGWPVLGPDPEILGLHYATGHYRNGILLAPRTAQLAAETILSGESGPELQPFSVGRLTAAKAVSL
jgi:glycine oxidase